MPRDYREDRYDFTAGRKNAPELIVMVGVSGSGKSTLVKKWINEARGQMVRVNRDSLRAMLFNDVPWNSRDEEVTRCVQKEAVRIAIIQGRDVVVDDTNVVRRTRYGWEEFAQECRLKLRVVTMLTDLDECIRRNETRQGKEKVPVEVIQKQHKQLNEFAMAPERKVETFCRPVWDREQLRTGGFHLERPDAAIVLVDVDGTLASCEGIRSPYDESKVLLDNVQPVVADWVRALHGSYNVFIVSGRHDTCGTDTVEWLEANDIPFSRILMRRGGDNRPDYIIKTEILNEIVNVFGKERIAFVLDDRPQVIRMWKKQGLTVYPVAGTTDHHPACPNLGVVPTKNGDQRCTECGALKDF